MHDLLTTLVITDLAETTTQQKLQKLLTAVE